MKRFIFFLYFLVSSYALAASEREAALDIYKADTDTISGKGVRYYQALSSPCIKIQILKPGGGGVASNSMDFCSISGKSFLSDYAEIWLEKGEFSNSELLLTLRLLPVRQYKDQVAVCKFKVEGEKLSGPNCVVQ